MTCVAEIYDLIQRKAPFEIQAGFDNAGFLIGRRATPVTGVLIALDITKSVVEEAIELGAQLIISHHPIIFSGVKRLTDETPAGDLLLTMAEQGISAICAHTNLDAVSQGVNDVLAQCLGLKHIQLLKLDGVDNQGNAYGIGRMGEVEPQCAHHFAKHVKEVLQAGCVKVVDGGRPVHRVAVGGGSCGSMLGDVLAAGCDTFVTADVKYDVFLDAKSHGLNLLDAGHFPTENVICSVLQNWVTDAFPELTVEVSQNHREIYHCI